MPRKQALFKTFLIVFFISVFLLMLTNLGFLNGFTAIISKVTFPIQKNIYKTFGFVFRQDQITDKDLEVKNLEFNNKLIEYEKLKKDNQALRDQFSTENFKSTDFLPANVIGFPSFIPNVSFPETIIIDKGLDDGLITGQAVVFKNNLIGKIYKLTANKSLVYLITNPNISFTAKTLDSQSEGVVKGLGGGEMILDNVLLSNTLKKDELVLTKGDLTIEGRGFPSDLVIGKIIAIDKNPSSLFQSAGIKNLIDYSKLTTVFVYMAIE